MRFAGRSLYAFGQLIVLRLPNIVVLMLLTRFQGAEAAGLFSLAITYLILLTAWWVGLDELVIRETARAGTQDAQQGRNATRRTIYAYGALRTSVALVLFLAVIGFLRLNRTYTPADWRFIAVLLLSSIADGFTGAVQAGLIGRERFGHAFTMTAIQTGLRIGLVSAVIALNLGILAIAWAWTAGAVVGVLVALFALHAVIPPGPRSPHDTRVKQAPGRWISEGWAFLVIGIVATLEYQQDIIVLSAYQPLATVGYYSVATTLFASVALPIQALRMVLFPRMARAAAHQASDANVTPDIPMRDLHAYAAQWLLAVGMLCGFLGFVYAPQFITLLFGANMLPSVPSARLLMVALVFFALNVPQSRLLLATGRQNRTAALITISTVANLIANLILARLYGAPGAALARNISTALYLGLAVITLAGATRRPTWPALLAPLLAATLAAGVAFLLAPWPWPLAAALSTAVYLAVLAAILKLTNNWNLSPTSANAGASLPG